MSFTLKFIWLEQDVTGTSCINADKMYPNKMLPRKSGSEHPTPHLQFSCYPQCKTSLEKWQGQTLGLILTQGQRQRKEFNSINTRCFRNSSSAWFLKVTTKMGVCVRVDNNASTNLTPMKVFPVPGGPWTMASRLVMQWTNAALWDSSRPLKGNNVIFSQ